MKPLVVFGGSAGAREVWRPELEAAFLECGLSVSLEMDPENVRPADADYLICADHGAARDLDAYRNAKAILSLWAGVDWLRHRTPPPGVPIVRMVEDGMTQGMTDYVLAQVLRYHVGLHQAIPCDDWEIWGKATRPLSRHRRVGIAGLGALGAEAARLLKTIGFDVRGWSRNRKSLPGITCHAGPAELPGFLSTSEILILLLPLTAETESMFGQREFAMLPDGAFLINAARGGVIDDQALIEALDTNRVAHATLDVFRIEPLPKDHAFRLHPRVTVTPHIASVTRPDTAARSIARQVLRSETGLPLENLYDPARGY